LFQQFISRRIIPLEQRHADTSGADLHHQAELVGVRAIVVVVTAVVLGRSVGHACSPSFSNGAGA
jgi:hypothetical protein